MRSEIRCCTTQKHTFGRTIAVISRMRAALWGSSNGPAGRDLQPGCTIARGGIVRGTGVHRRLGRTWHVTHARGDPNLGSPGRKTGFIKAPIGVKRLGAANAVESDHALFS